MLYVLVDIDVDKVYTIIYHRSCEVSILSFCRVQFLQLPGFQQNLLPQALVAADASAMADSPVTMTTIKPAPGKDMKKPQMDSPEDDAANPTLKLVTRVLDTLRTPAVAAIGQRLAAPVASALLAPQRRALPGCPLCDASVYSYCDYKVFHDGCCCGTNSFGGGFGGGFGVNGIGYGSCGQQEDCSILYANSCYEHQLIVNCCCNSPY
ncbi:uncharacterized protein LOC129755666 [Uranotaenia lowii]|uniref:uncharacterized protein LOC129755666 n=1 Tax=Uranotaenia lowii TaxID=190385 RepID=UPI00247B0CF2|nr:uncharacterized protein LOC129755666 [Uranotaenia lowii]